MMHVRLFCIEYGPGAVITALFQQRPTPSPVLADITHQLRQGYRGSVYTPPQILLELCWHPYQLAKDKR